MVKVISAYNFQSQNILTLTGDIVQICEIDVDDPIQGNERLAVAYRTHQIEIVDLEQLLDCGKIKKKSNTVQNNDEDTLVEHSEKFRRIFPTIDQVEQMIYCKTGNFLATLECQATATTLAASSLSYGTAQPQEASGKKFIRIYSNYEAVFSVHSTNNNRNTTSESLGDSFLNIQPRIASQVTPPSQTTASNNFANTIDVIELPSSSDGIDSYTPELIACCKFTGTIAICTGQQEIHFYQLVYRECAHNTKRKFIDFRALPIVIQLDFQPVRMEIAENVIAVESRHAVLAFKINDYVLRSNGDDDFDEDEHQMMITTATTTSSVDLSVASGTSDASSKSCSISSDINTYRLPQCIDYPMVKQVNTQLKSSSKYYCELEQIMMAANENGRQMAPSDHDDDLQLSHVQADTIIKYSEEKPTLVNGMRLTLRNLKSPNITSTKDDRRFYTIKSLIQLRLAQDLPTKESVGLIRDEFTLLTLKPIYCKRRQCDKDDGLSLNDVADKDGGISAFRSKSRNTCLSYTLFISTVSDGYLYQLTSHGKWYTENTKCLAVYPFTAPVRNVIVDDFVIHAIVETGIETYSSRIGHKLFASSFEYPTLSSPYPAETSPMVDIPVCVLGVCGFFGVKFVCASANRLILLATDVERQPMKHSITNNTGQRPQSSKFNWSLLNNNRHLQSGEKNRRTENRAIDWTLYNLRLPEPKQLVADILETAQLFRLTSPDYYYELVEEAHIISRLTRILMQRTEVCDDEYRTTCRLLADFTIRSNRKEVYSEAVAYYRMAGITIPQIFNDEYLQRTRKREEEGNEENLDGNVSVSGLIYTLELLLSNLCGDKSAGEFLTQTAIDGVLTQKEEFSSSGTGSWGEALLKFFAVKNPSSIAKIALKSSAFREILNENLMKFFTETINSEKNGLSPEEELCYMQLLVYKNRPIDAIAVLEKMSRRELFCALTQNWEVIFDGAAATRVTQDVTVSGADLSFSDLTENCLFVSERCEMIDSIADSLTYLLIERHCIQLGTMLRLFMNFFAVHLGTKSWRVSQKIFEICLQAYFYYFTMTDDEQQQKTLPSCICPVGTAGFTEQEKFCKNCGKNRKRPTANAIDQKHRKYSTESTETLLLGQQQQQTTTTTTTTNTTTTTTNTFSLQSNAPSECEAMQLLFRTYLGLLMEFSMTAPIKVDKTGPRYTAPGIIDSSYETITNYRDQLFENLCENRQEVKIHNQQIHNSSNCFVEHESFDVIPKYYTEQKSLNIGSNQQQFRRPIVFYEKREEFLNFVPPFDELMQSASAVDDRLASRIDGTNTKNSPKYFEGWHFEGYVVLLKLQSLLCSGRLEGHLIDDFCAFLKSMPISTGVGVVKPPVCRHDLLGIDSLLLILLLRADAEEFLIRCYSQALPAYTKARDYQPNDYADLFRRILKIKRSLDPNSYCDAIKYFDSVIDDLLNYLVAETAAIEDLIKCIPPEEIDTSPLLDCDFDNSKWKLDDVDSEMEENGEVQTDGERKRTKYRRRTQDDIDETNAFQLIMRKAVAKQRCQALNAMISATGRQLYDVIRNYNYYEPFNI